MITLPFLYDYVFPNFIMPNALITEYGILNYLNSLYSNTHRNNSFSDSNLHDPMHSGPKLIFDNKLGHWPNTLWNHGTHLNSGAFSEYLRCDHESLFFGKKKWPKYIYPIKMSPHIDDFTGVGPVGSKLNGEYFWKHMSQEALEDAQKGNAVILLDLGQENFFPKSTYIKLHTALERSGIPPQQIVLIFNSFNAKEIYESWFAPEERRLEVMNFPFIICNTSYHWNIGVDFRLSEEIFYSTRDVLRKNYFLFKIRRQRQHRLAILYKLATDNHLAKGDWACISNLHFNPHEVQNLASAYGFEANLEIVEDVCKKIPHRLQDEPNSTFESVGAWSDKNGDSYKNSYFYICTETYTEGEYQSLTEKVFKPIVNFQPFFFMAYPGSLKVLHKLGFKTFHPFIDESYDDEKDEATRFRMIYAEINRLCSMSKEDLHNWYWSMEEILLHNHRAMIDFYKNDTSGLKLIASLKQKLI